jgi:AAA domain (dynein-related subfamily)
MQVFSSSSEARYHDKLINAREVIGKSVVTRQEILKYQEDTGKNLPAKFWTEARVGRGMFTLDLPQQPQVVNAAQVVAMKPVPQAAQAVVTASNEQFNVDSLVPSLKETFVPWGNFQVVEQLLASKQFFTLYITGESGTGKNEMVSQACAKLGRPLVRVAITAETKEEHLIGSKTLKEGNIVFEDGPVKWAAENGAVLLLDEISCGHANELMCIQGILEGGSFFVKSANVMVKPKEGFCIIATDNTKGRGSESGRYIGTNILNDAFLERFEMTMEQGYPPEKIERKIIEKQMSAVGLTDSNFSNRLVTWVQAIRKTYNEDGLEEQITTRRACHIIRTYAKLRKAELAIELCCARFDETTKMAMVSLWEKLIPVAPAESNE